MSLETADIIVSCVTQIQIRVDLRSIGLDVRKLKGKVYQAFK